MENDALRKLRDAVKAGTLPESVFHGTSSVRGHWAYTLPFDVVDRRNVFCAYRGSLDAAHALHKAVLPGWEWNIDAGDGASIENRGAFGDMFTGDVPGNPARAWLLAILNALIAQQDATINQSEASHD